MKELLEVLQPVLILLIGTLSTYLGAKIGGFFKEKTTELQRNKIIATIKASVMFVEQITGEHMLSEDKLALAKHRALASIQEMGLSITDEELTMWIENFVHGLKEGE